MITLTPDFIITILVTLFIGLTLGAMLRQRVLVLLTLVSTLLASYLSFLFSQGIIPKDGPLTVVMGLSWVLAMTLAVAISQEYPINDKDQK